MRRDGCNKIFQKPLDWKKVEKNRSKGIEITSALQTTSKNQVHTWRKHALLQEGCI
jgi:hypothetical protein